MLPAPIAGIAIRWTLQVGGGSFLHVERFTSVASDELAQVPIVLERPGNSVQLSAEIVSSIPDARRVTLSALVAPLSPTWSTELVCP